MAKRPISSGIQADTRSSAQVQETGINPSGVTKIVAGSGVSISPPTGVGVVTVTNTATGSGTVTQLNAGTGITLTPSPITTTGTIAVSGNLATLRGLANALGFLHNDGSGTLAWNSAGTGTVTSFSAGNFSPLFTTTVGTPTSTPALAFVSISQTANTFFCAPNGSAGNPTFRAILAADIPALPYVLVSREPINVKNYGAVGDGATNDTTWIANALAAVAASGGGGLYFPPGVYMTDEIVVSSKNGITIFGDGTDAVTIKNRVFGRVLSIDSSCSNISIHGLSLDGNCFVRTQGQQAFNIDCQNVDVYDVEVLHSGEFAVSCGYNGQIRNLQLSNVRVKDCYADGININGSAYGASKIIIANCLVDGADDDLLALGSCTDVVVTGLFLRASTNVLAGQGISYFNRIGTVATAGGPGLGGADKVGAAFTITGSVAPFNGTFTVNSSPDGSTIVFTVPNSGATYGSGAVQYNALYTGTGRGIYINGCSDVNISDVQIDTVKQDGLWIINEGGGRPTRVKLCNVKIVNCATVSGSGPLIQNTTDCLLQNVTIENPQRGNLLLLLDFQNLQILNCILTQEISTAYCRGIFTADWSTSGTPWNRLTIKGCHISLLAGTTNQCIFIAPTAGCLVSNLVIDNNTCRDINANTSIWTNNLSVQAKIMNNIALESATAPANGGGGLAPTYANNN